MSVPSAKCRTNGTQHLRECAEVSVVDHPPVDLLGELVQCRHPGGAFREDFDFYFAGDLDRYLDLDDALHNLP
jgi:hypothetical protein